MHIINMLNINYFKKLNNGRKTVKKYTLIFSFLLVLILFGICSVSAADADGPDPVMLENEDICLSQEDAIDSNQEKQILNNNDNQANLCETDIGYSQDVSANDLGSVDDELILEEPADEENWCGFCSFFFCSGVCWCGFCSFFFCSRTCC